MIDTTFPNTEKLMRFFLRQDTFLVVFSHHCCPFPLLSSFQIVPKLELCVLFFPGRVCSAKRNPNSMYVSPGKKAFKDFIAR